MDEALIIKTYNESINSVVTLVKDIGNELGAVRYELQGIKAENQKLTERISELEARLNKNSGNSSKPPSSDDFKKPRNMREKSGKHTGGQPGHEGRTLNKVENPDEIIDIEPDKCDCGCDLSGVEGSCQTRQVVEIPVIKTKVTEYRTFKKVCPGCKKVHNTEFPKAVTQPVQYGENMLLLSIKIVQKCRRKLTTP